ncbi:hypothetical protein MPSEU_000030400 [Mayamaea pseudoterrestris]|nr:hypothetical protein MPSEU_000030400 [Mayamaea pseudoterrestris]
MMNDKNTSRKLRLEEARRRWLGLDPRDDALVVAQQLQDVRNVFEHIYKDPESSTEERVVASERLALLLIQNGNDESIRKADAILESLGFVCRLSRQILGYQLATNSQMERATSRTSTMVPCCGFDDFLSPSQLQGLHHVYLNPQAPYWTTHNYQVEPPSPYYSYVLPLDSPLLFPNTLLGSIVQKILAQIAVFQPSAAKQAKYLELWAHNRPIATGHQLHFDSDNEGADAVIKHPLTTSIIYLTSHGGPTLITNQRLVSRQAADKGWLLHARTNRVLHVDGRVLHCVVPGNVLEASKNCHANNVDESSNCRRVSLMLALWRSIRTRDEATPGAARPFPTDASWAAALTAPMDTAAADQDLPLDPILVKHVYERVSDGCGWSRDDGLPSYDQVFQGI